jgi:hypothetical protein
VSLVIAAGGVGAVVEDSKRSRAVNAAAQPSKQALSRDAASIRPPARK